MSVCLGFCSSVFCEGFRASCWDPSKAVIRTVFTWFCVQSKSVAYFLSKLRNVKDRQCRLRLYVSLHSVGLKGMSCYRPMMHALRGHKDDICSTSFLSSNIDESFKMFHIVNSAKVNFFANCVVVITCRCSQIVQWTSSHRLFYRLQKGSKRRHFQSSL